MRQKRIELDYDEHPQKKNKKSSVESKIMKLVIDGYLHGAQTCELHNGKVLGVSIHQGKSDNIHLFVDHRHEVTVQVKNGMSQISVVKNKEVENIDYVLPFTKCLGLSESIVMRSYEEN